MTGSGGRIASFVALFGAMLLLGFGTGLSFDIDHTEEARRLDNLAAQARILAATETAALAFNDRQAAQEYLIALHANPAILAAGLYTPSGALFVSYPDKPPASLPRALQEPIPRSSGNVLSVTEPVEQGRTLLGRLIGTGAGGATELPVAARRPDRPARRDGGTARCGARICADGAATGESGTRVRAPRSL